MPDARRLHVGEFCESPDMFAGVQQLKSRRIEEWKAEFQAMTAVTVSVEAFVLDDGWLLALRRQ
jgi:hypothetical protein